MRDRETKSGWQRQREIKTHRCLKWVKGQVGGVNGAEWVEVRGLEWYGKWTTFFISCTYTFWSARTWQGKSGSERERNKARVRTSGGKRLKTDKVRSAFFNLFWSNNPLRRVAAREQENANNASLFAFSKISKCGATQRGPWQFHKEMLITGPGRD